MSSYRIDLAAQTEALRPFEAAGNSEPPRNRSDAVDQAPCPTFVTTLALDVETGSEWLQGRYRIPRLPAAERGRPSPGVPRMVRMRVGPMVVVTPRGTFRSEAYEWPAPIHTDCTICEVQGSRHAAGGL